jgi:hypothetical protein
MYNAQHITMYNILTIGRILRRYAALLRRGAIISVGFTHGYQDCIPNGILITNYELKITKPRPRLFVSPNGAQSLIHL